MEDIERDRYNFIDGCGVILIECVRKVMEELNIGIVYEGVKLFEILFVF